MKVVETIYSSITDKVIGLSISESEDLARLGFGLTHLEDAKIEIARHLISCGASLMYGGDLRDNGYTQKLFDLVENYRVKALPEDKEVLINVLGWPLQQTLTLDLRASLSDRISFVETGLPDDLPQGLSAQKYLNPTTNKEIYTWVRTMSHMREYMTQKNDARVILGGKTKGYKGKYPGIVEEALLSLISRKPTYLIGAFGGATADVIDAIKGNIPERLIEAYQLKSEELFETVSYYNANKPENLEPISYPKLVEFFNEKGVESLNNGLTKDENNRLFETIHIPEMISLILKGLVNVYKP